MSHFGLYCLLWSLTVPPKVRTPETPAEGPTRCQQCPHNIPEVLVKHQKLCTHNEFHSFCPIFFIMISHRPPRNSGRPRRRLRVRRDAENLPTTFRKFWWCPQIYAHIKSFTHFALYLYYVHSQPPWSPERPESPGCWLKAGQDAVVINRVYMERCSIPARIVVNGV